MVVIEPPRHDTHGGHEGSVFDRNYRIEQDFKQAAEPPIIHNPVNPVEIILRVLGVFFVPSVVMRFRVTFPEKGLSLKWFPCPLN
jgi:hypothetical protein